MKFKKQSQMSNKDNFDKILDKKARISINTKTGKHDFTYGNKSALKDLQYMQNSDSLVNCMYDSSVLDNMAPIRPSKLIWQLPYEERKSFLN
jgi:hypothetical protein